MDDRIKDIFYDATGQTTRAREPGASRVIRGPNGRWFLAEWQPAKAGTAKDDKAKSAPGKSDGSEILNPSERRSDGGYSLREILPDGQVQGSDGLVVRGRLPTWNPEVSGVAGSLAQLGFTEVYQQNLHLNAIDADARYGRMTDSEFPLLKEAGVARKAFDEEVARVIGQSDPLNPAAAAAPSTGDSPVPANDLATVKTNVAPVEPLPGTQAEGHPVVDEGKIV